MTDKQFTVAYQYRLYLERLGMNEANMHPTQRRQLKQAFYGAWGQCQIHMRDEVSEIPDENEAVDIMESQMKEVHDFFLTETNQKN